MSLYNIIKSKDLKLISPFIEGGTSKLKKKEKEELEVVMDKYNKNDKEYFFSEKSILLDEEQHQIVTSKPNQNIRILAGAGSGKTTTILCRVKYLLDNFTTPNRVLILTFNKDSSENLKNRVVKLFNFNINIDIYTIDAFCCLLYHKFHNQKSYISLSEYVIYGRKIMMDYGSEIAAKYNYVFFDEFQDVNSIQFDILNQFVKNGCFLTVIGDDSQNIYQFRGTDNYFMLNFDNIFKNTSTYTLTSNYRSTKSIVKLANNLISLNENQVKKVMKTNNDKGYRPKFILSETEENQIEFIIGKIQSLIEEGVNPDEIAILSRNAYHLKIMETELIKYDIPLVASITDKIGENIKKILEPNKVAVTTIHKSKGLEWSHVFILGFCHHHFPSHLNNNIKNIEEERRLFYVGCTRAKNRLYLMALHSEIPISCFIKENLDHLKVVYNPKGYKPSEDIFDYKDDTMIKEEYTVNDLILLLNTETLDEMRQNKFITDFEIDVSTIISSLDLDSEIKYTEEIKKGAYEPDFGEFVDRYITRQLIINSKQEFKDLDCLSILNAIILDNNEMEVYNKYKLQNIVLNLNTIQLDEKSKNLVNKLIKKDKHIPYQSVFRENTYPSHVMKKLQKSYNKCQTEIHNNQIIEDVYNISLCRNFNNDRRRLVYRNVLDLFERMLDNGIKTKMDKYIDLMSEHKTTCKKTIFHRFKEVAVLKGETDIIDWSEETLIDIKCSESDFKLEWYIQLLIYFSFLKDKEKDKIKYFGIINIMDGKYYKINLPNIDYEQFIKYIELMIKRDQNNYRICNNPLNMNSLQYVFKPDDSSNKSIIFDKKEGNLIMFMDTETSGFYNDILQLAYVVCDTTGKIIKKVSRYVKNRLPTIESTKIHGIDIDKIKSEGIDFFEIIKEFFNNLSDCKTIVGHNLQYDLNTIQNDIRTYGINLVDSEGKPILNFVSKIKTQDTMNMGPKKKIKLEELYHNLFNSKFDGAHNALYDVIATKDCYFKLNQMNNTVI